MSDDREREVEHDFDGIEELDNDLPGWWLGIFWVTILLALFYVPYYHWLHPEKLPVASLKASMAAAERASAAGAGAAGAGSEGASSPSALQARYEAGGWQESARADYNAYCSACHLADGGGSIGPNFTDDYTIHGGTMPDIIRVITEGVPEKGMVSWQAVLKPEQIENLAFYIHSMRGTTPAVAKEPQGEKIEDEALSEAE